MDMQRTLSRDLAVITGCDSGLGKSLAVLLATAGYQVVATYLDDHPCPDRANIAGIRMDLRSPDDMERLVSAVDGYRRSGYRLAFLVNNAGVARGGPIEDLPLSIYREVFEINFFGLVRLTQLLMPSLIPDGGRIVIIGSLAGRIATPFMAPYVASKFALEGWVDCLRRELRPLRVPVILLEPAGIETPIWHRRYDDSYIGERYRRAIAVFRERFIESRKPIDADRAARLMARVITARRPRSRAVISGEPIMTRILLLIPRRLMDRLVVRAFSMDYGSPAGKSV